jgi:phosphate transport system permease protein
MVMTYQFIALLVFAAVAMAMFALGRSRSLSLVDGNIEKLHSNPGYHGYYLAITSVFPAFILAVVWLFAEGFLSATYVTRSLGEPFAQLDATAQATVLRSARLILSGAATAANELEANAALFLGQFESTAVWIVLVALVALFIGGLAIGYRSISPQWRARHVVERTIMGILIAASVVAIVTTLGIVLSLLFESIRFFEKVPFFSFLFGTHWSPQSAFEGAGQDTSARNGEVFGAVPVFTGTLLITAIAILVAAPIGLMSAIYLSDYATPAVRSIAKPLLEVLAGIPTVVYGFFAALTIAPIFRSFGLSIGLDVSSESAIAAGLVMGVMIIPFVSSLSDDVINAVPQSLRDGSAGLGATKSETIRRVVLPAALPGIVSALMLAVSRAIGETMIVVMAAGLAANLTANPFQAVTTVTVQIVTLLVGDQEFDSAKTLAAFALGLVLFCVTLVLNIIALQVIRKYQEQYD